MTERGSAVGPASHVVTFQYDAFDRRTGKQVDGDADGTVDREEAWVWQSDQVALQLVDADGAGAGVWKLTNRYLYGDIIDMVLADEQFPSGGIGLTTVSGTSGTVLWPLADHLGSVRDLVDSNGVIREHVVYDSFGNRLSESDFDSAGNAISGSDPAAVDHLFGYTGREWDDDVDLQYNRARWYDPVQGRWISQDPIGFAAGDVNQYRYVGNGPTNATDPSGLRTVNIEIVYHLKNVALTPAMKKEVNRIFQNAMKRCGGSNHKMNLVWIDAGSSKNLAKREKDKGFWGGAWVTGNNPLGVVVLLDDALTIRIPGQAGGFAATINPNVIRAAAKEAGKNFDLAVAATIAHEIGLHCIGEKHGHYVDRGFVDASHGGQIGGAFSDKAAHNLIDQLDLEEGDE